MLLCPFLFPQSHYYVVEKIQKGMLPSLTLITLISVGPLSPLDCTELSLSLALWAKLHTATTFMGSMQHLLAAQGALHLPPPRDNCSHCHCRSFALGWGEGGKDFQEDVWIKEFVNLLWGLWPGGNMKLPLLLTLCDKLAVATKANSDSHWWWKCAWICPKCKSEGAANKSLTCDPLHTSHCNSLKPVLPKAEHVNFTSNCTVNRSCTCPVCLSLVTLCTELHVGHCNFASDSSQLCPKRRRTLPGRKLLGPSQRFLVSAVLHHKGHLRTHLRTHSGEKWNQCDYAEDNSAWK